MAITDARRWQIRSRKKHGIYLYIPAFVWKCQEEGLVGFDSSSDLRWKEQASDWMNKETTRKYRQHSRSHTYTQISFLSRTEMKSLSETRSGVLVDHESVGREI